MNATVEAMHVWRERPDLFARDVFGHRLAPFQRRIAHALYAHRRVAVQSATNQGKTFLAALLVRHFLLGDGTGRRSRVLTTATNWPQVEKVLWAEIHRQGRDAAPRIGGGFDEKLDLTSLRCATGEAYGLSTDDPTAFQGSHWDRQLIIFDEASGVRPAIHAAAESLMSGRDCYWFQISNPDRISGPFYEACQRPDLWHVVELSALDHPNVVTGRQVIPGAVSREWVEERRRVWGEDSNQWRVYVLGKFPLSDSGTLIPIDLLRAASERTPTAKDGAHMGVDLSLGGDETVATLVVNRVVTAQKRWRQADPMASTGTIVQLMGEWGVPAENVHVDVCGLGAGPVARLHELGHSVDGVDFGAGAEGDWDGIFLDTRFHNRRVELYHVARQLLKDGELRIPAEYQDTWADLAAVQMAPVASDGACKLEPKDAVKRRLGRSPDCGDSLVLALARRRRYTVEFLS